MPAPVRKWLERNYYAKVTSQANIEHAIHDPTFWERPGKHVALFSDHGVVHARDVASQVLEVIDTINGLLIERRPAARLCFMHGYGVMLAWLHDIGMCDFSPMGRAMHPEYAAQAVFTPAFDWLVETLWREDKSGIAERLSALFADGALSQAPQIVFRELLTMSVCHSKSKVPVHVLANRTALRKALQTATGTDLVVLYRMQYNASDNEALTGDQVAPAVSHSRFYQDFFRDSFQWLASDQPAVQALIDDVIDTIRALRAADALRQRGTVLKTSAGYEVFVSRQTGNAMFALRRGDDQLLLYELTMPQSSGEANMASCELDPNGDLRISFHRGAFDNAEAVQRAAEHAAFIINDIQADVITSFLYPSGAPAKLAKAMRILIEDADDNLQFAGEVKTQFGLMNPLMLDAVSIVPSLQNASIIERNRYLNARDIDWDESRRIALLDRLVQSGYKRRAFDAMHAFEHARLATARAGETLIEAGAPSGFVYLPLGDGLQVMPLGGYAPFAVHAWMPLGVTGVIRGASRNANVVATKDLEVIIIPAQVYWRHWHNPYHTTDLKRMLLGD